MSEIYLKRKIDSFLLNWKESKDKLPLIIKGARQIGKTESILHFARKQNTKVLSISILPKNQNIKQY